MNGFTDNLVFLGDDLTLCEIGIADEEDIFVWNGVEVKKVLKYSNTHDHFRFFLSQL